MWRILRGLYLGNSRDAYDLELLRGIGVTHVLNCAREVPCFQRRHFRYLHLKLYDPDPCLIDHIDRLCRFIRLGRRRGCVLVHCAQGMSRSPAAILAYLCRRGKSLDDALTVLQRRVAETDDHFILPDAGFLAQLESFFEE
ncbi:MAG: dual specificity protein phosphatase family protein [Planctomycetaceae bacterium]